MQVNGTLLLLLQKVGFKHLNQHWRHDVTKFQFNLMTQPCDPAIHAKLHLTLNRPPMQEAVMFSLSQQTLSTMPHDKKATYRCV